ncbi:sterigmatocystin 8-O-methyltransferase [Nemania abortiva]|nr:sterigmatocystin 8-O-methyltransferase [Nemania abortiva]
MILSLRTACHELTSKTNEYTRTTELLAEKISLAVTQITVWCADNNQSLPSSGTNATNLMLPASAPQTTLTAREELIESARKIQQLVLEPSEYLPQMATHAIMASIHWLCHFRIFSLVPLQGSAPFAQVAAQAKVPEGQLKAIARMAMTFHVFCEVKSGELAHTSISALFANSQAVRDWAIFMAGFSAPAASKMVEATERWGETTALTQTAFNIANETNLPFFEYMTQTPARSGLFASYMKNVTASAGLKIEHLVHGFFDWNGLQKATVVDVGGSTCHTSIALAEAYPLLEFIVQDLPATVASGRELLAKQPERIRSRIVCEEHDFFTPQSGTAADADVFLLRMILHDWPDDKALTILRQLVAPMKARSLPDSRRPSHVRLIIMDTVLPLPGEIGARREAMLRVRDLTMLQAFNSRERELEDWKALLTAASGEAVGDGELELISLNQPFGSHMSILEIAYRC